VHRLATISGRLSIASAEPGRPDSPAPWLVLDSVPAAIYELQVSTTRPRAGELLVCVAGEATPIRRLQVKPASRQLIRLALSVGAPRLVVLPDAGLEKIGGRIELRPLQMGDPALSARQERSYGASTVYFLDDHVFAETEGFWVKGGAAAGIVLERQGSQAASFTLTLQNGRSANRVVLADGDTQRHETFGPFETKTIELAPDAAGVARLSISSAAGFRPADDGVSRDGRFLGVWIKPR
jgi:hypothetical protein